MNINDYFDFTPRDRQKTGLSDNQVALIFFINILIFLILAYLVDFNI